ncbi:proline--tRNA ligase, putative [Plasmodium malariae]|uniref:Proline--tRNA ligase, putative n=1 Tax=Plasmodium malariae TaxID=5858 RepID=A0A1D3JMX1_PLAMA|nr:proline--tRNA ligase, putative [Plasmodium malariae]SBT87906.1 proline--tRNA ligase, putative [Plasmodium malariae]
MNLLYFVFSSKLDILKKKKKNIFFINKYYNKTNYNNSYNNTNYNNSNNNGVRRKIIKRYNALIVLSCNKKSYFGSEYIFNKIYNDNIKQNGDKASELLQRANYIRDVNGLYNILPLGLRVINKIKYFVNHHLEKINSHCLMLSILQAKKLWNISDRSKLYSDEFLYVYKQKQQKLNKNAEEIVKNKMEDDGCILSPTCEEASLSLINQVFNENITAKCLPILIHQFNYKFRNEKRFEKSLFKSKEFLMKDGYSFHSSEKCMNETYEIYKNCYSHIFQQLNITHNIIKKRKKDKMNAVESHEFQVLCRDGKYKEAAHIFKLGDYYSKKLNIKYLDKKNEKKYILMGSYGIGIYRLLYFLVDSFYDHEGIKLPEHLAPFTVYLIQTNQKSKYSSTKIRKILGEVKTKAGQVFTVNDAQQKEALSGGAGCNENKENNENKTIESTERIFYNPLNSNDVEYVLALFIYNTFKNNNVDIYYDDTDLHLSRKLKNCDLIGVPNRIIINLNKTDKNVKVPVDFYNYIDSSHNILTNKLYLAFQNITIEHRKRSSQETKMMTIQQLFRYFKFM